MNVPRTSCAFHNTMLITHFCQSSTCLLPLCQQCIAVHKRQHASIQQSIKIVPIQYSIKDIQRLAAKENSRIEEIYRQTLNSFEKSLTLHHALKNQLFQEQNQLINSIALTYGSIIQEVQNNIKRKQLWLREFTIHVNLARTQLIKIQNSLSGENYLRYIIMWNKLKPHHVISEVISNQKFDLPQPNHQRINIHNFIQKLQQSQNLQLFQLTGDVGISKIIDAFQVLRFGENEPRSPRQSGIVVTERKRIKKLSSIKHLDNR